MKTKAITLFVIAFIALIASCNKKDTKPSNEVAKTLPTPSSSMVFGGIFDFYNIQTYSSGVGYYNQYAMQCAFFNNNNSNAINAGNVSINNVSLFCDAQYDNWYLDTTYTINYLQLNYSINVSGNASVQSFNYAFTPIKPSFNGDSLLPDTFSKSAGFTINFGNTIQNITDSVIVSLDGASKKMPPNQTSITFTSNDLAIVSTGTIVSNQFKVELSNVKKFTVNNTDYYIRNLLSHSKYNIIVMP